LKIVNREFQNLWLDRRRSAMQCHTVRCPSMNCVFEQTTGSSYGKRSRSEWLTDNWNLGTRVSDFTHARPVWTDGDMRRSSGPIYVRSAFNHLSWIQFESFALCYVLASLAGPTLPVPRPILELFRDLRWAKSRVTRAAFSRLRGEI
jgi:hypothetical protein